MVEQYEPFAPHPRTIHIANKSAQVEGGTLKLIWDNDLVVALFDPEKPYGTLFIVNAVQPHVNAAIQHWWKRGFLFDEDVND